LPINWCWELLAIEIQ